MEQSKFIKKENDLAEYEIDETNKNAKGVSDKVYKAEKIERKEARRWNKKKIK